MDDNRLSMQGQSHTRSFARSFAKPVALPFRAVLQPYRSLTERNFLVLMGILGVVSFITGAVFAAIGAWPVMGFFGLDVALIWLAFRINYRAARSTETVEVTRDDLTVTQVSANGRRRSQARFSPTWARLDEREAPDGSVELLVASHGRQVRVARDLGSDERRSFAVVLRAALRLVREPEWPTAER